MKKYIVFSIFLALLFDCTVTKSQPSITGKDKHKIEIKIPCYQVGDQVYLQVGPFCCAGTIKQIVSSVKGVSYFIDFCVLYCTAPDGRIPVQPSFHLVWKSESEIRKFK